MARSYQYTSAISIGECQSLGPRMDSQCVDLITSKIDILERDQGLRSENLHFTSRHHCALLAIRQRDSSIEETMLSGEVEAPSRNSQCAVLLVLSI